VTEYETLGYTNCQYNYSATKQAIMLHYGGVF